VGGIIPNGGSLAKADSQALRQRQSWDNTPHFPNLPNAPHHIHDGKTGEVTPGKPISIFVVLDEIAKT